MSFSLLRGQDLWRELPVKPCLLSKKKWVWPFRGKSCPPTFFFLSHPQGCAPNYPLARPTMISREGWLVLRERERERETGTKGVRDAMLQSASRCIWWENLLTTAEKNKTLRSVRTIQGRFPHLLNKGRARRKDCTCWMLIRWLWWSR